MSDQYVGEIRLFVGNYAPAGWALCNGQLLSVAEYELLYSVIGTVYGGDGTNNFALPDLQGRVAVHMGTSVQGTSYARGDKKGTETVTLLESQLPQHTHIASAQQNPGESIVPTNRFWAASTVKQYSSAAPNATMNPGTVSGVGGNQSHNNMMPFMALTYIIATEGMYPVRPN
ncbi:phage tail protein [Paenibacillus sp. y28]|uniref:phage tail protein n=1 Tax=Paenibacillus sp. y28 TaxID=3129110 RepID=UPI003019BAF9